MFKRRFGHRPRSKKLETRAHASRAFKRKVTNKVININVKCQQICTEPLEVCPNGGKHILVASAELFGAGSPNVLVDALRIVRLEGVLWMQPDYSNLGASGGSCEESLSLIRQPTIFRMGLLKSRVQQTLGGIPVAVNPLSDGANPYQLADCVDQRWLKTWDHLFQVKEGAECAFTTNSVICCGNDVPIVVPPTAAGESPGYTIPAAACFPCEGQVSGTVSTQYVEAPPWKAFHINYRRPIVMNENDALDLWYGWELMRPCDDQVPRQVQPPMRTVGHVFMTLET